MVNNGNNIFTYWLKVKLRRWDKERNKPQTKALPPHFEDIDDWNIVRQLYIDYEERKRLKKIKFSLLFEENFGKTEEEHDSFREEEY